MARDVRFAELSGMNMTRLEMIQWKKSLAQGSFKTKLINFLCL